MSVVRESLALDLGIDELMEIYEKALEGEENKYNFLFVDRTDSFRRGLNEAIEFNKK